MITNRQKALYNFLMEKGEEWTPQAEIARELYADYGNAECCLEPKNYHDTTERILISDDIREINISPDFEKIIISNRKGIKIANETEFDRFINSQYWATVRKLSRIYKMAKKASRDNQIDFGGHTVESFLEKIPENT